MKIQCLMVNGGSLDNGLRTALLLTACSLIRSGKKSARFKDENGEGGVSTKRERKFASGYLQGIEFYSTVDYGGKTIKCKFLVDDRFLPDDDFLIENGRWVGTISPHDNEDKSDWWKE